MIEVEMKLLQTKYFLVWLFSSFRYLMIHEEKQNKTNKQKYIYKPQAQ